MRNWVILSQEKTASILINLQGFFLKLSLHVCVHATQGLHVSENR